MSIMSIEQSVLEKVRALPTEKLRTVLDFLTGLEAKPTPPPKAGKCRLMGLWADLDVRITDEDIAEARREMWGGFPRDI